MKYKNLNRQFKPKCKNAKQNFYKSFVQNLKESNPNNWYIKVKSLTQYNPYEYLEPSCEEISQYDDQTQSELIADHYESVAGIYSPLKDEDIKLPQFTQNEIPKISIKTVLSHLSQLK